MNQSDFFQEPGTPSAADMLAARRVALSILDHVIVRRLPLDQVIEDTRDYDALPVRDRAFVRMMVATTLRRLGQIDALIVQASERGDAPSPPILHHVLRLGVVQIMFMKVPAHAAVDTSVRLAEAAGLARQKGFVNAVLRRMTREGAVWLERQDPARLNIPQWMLQDWVVAYGLRAAAEIAAASLEEAPLDITLKDPSHAEHWASVLEAEILPTGSLRRAAGGNVAELNGFRDGLWWVQDAAAAIPARLFDAPDGKTIVDLCAAPGGKTAQLAAAGAHVVALDRSVRRLARLNENMRRLRLDNHVRSEAADALQWLPKSPVDAVLLDAPCSATGTIRRHPDVLHGKTADDVARLAAQQSRMLDRAALMLAPGGQLIYCTCSLQGAEGPDQVAAFLQRTDFVRQPIAAAEIGGLDDAITPDGDVRLLPTHLPGRGGMDGFFIARLRKP